MSAERVHVNDAEIAHYGALEGRPGIISIQGTGSNVFAVLEDGRKTRNAEFAHYASAGAVWLGSQAVFTALTEATAGCSDPLIDGLLTFWDVGSVKDLHALASRGWDLPREETYRRFGQVAKLTTEAAQAGSPIAVAVCERSANLIVQGICLLGPLFQSEQVEVAFIGSCVRSPFMSSAVKASRRRGLRKATSSLSQASHR